MTSPLTVMGANCVLWVEPDATLTIGTTPLAGGTTPPAITWVVSAPRTDVPFIQCDGAGSAVTATFRWSLDGGNSNQGAGLSAAALVTAMTAAGIVPTVPVGTYATNNTYKATVSIWPDQAGTPHNFTQASVTKQPVLLFNALNNHRGLQFDGSNDQMDSAIVLAAPGTTPVFYWGVVRQDVWVTARSVLGLAGAETTLRLVTAVGSPDIRQGLTTVGNLLTGLSVGVFGKIEAYWHNTVADYLSERSEIVTGTAASNNQGAGSGVTLCASNTATFSACTWLEFAIFNVLPTRQNLDDLNAFASAKYGPGVVGIVTTQNFTRTITAAPSYARSVGRAIASTITAAPSYARSVGRAIASTITAAPSYARSVGRAIASTITATPALAFTRIISRAYSAMMAATPSLAFTRNISRAYSAALTATVSFSGSKLFIDLKMKVRPLITRILMLVQRKGK